MTRLARGDLLPKILTPPPGRRARQLSRSLARSEAPGVNTLRAGAPTILWQEAKGANVLDVDGNRYLDLTSGFGVAAVGHRHPRVVAAVRRQAGQLLHGLGDVQAHPQRVGLAERLRRRVPVDDGQVYFAVSGADAVEIALKTALLATGRPGIVAFDPAYHGLTLGALHATSRPEFHRPFAQHLHPHVHRLPYGCLLGALDKVLRDSGDIGAVILEPLVGREGVIPPPSGWLRGVADLCREHGALLVADEILTGFGRTGHWFAVDAERIRPDLLCCGKALGGGMPIAATVGRRQVLAAWQTSGEALHTATFVAHPTACAAALEVLEILTDDKLPQRAARLGLVLEKRFGDWPSKFSAVTAVRGRGLLWGVELASREAASGVTRAALGRGLLILAGGATGRVLQLLPPLTISERQISFALEILEELLAEF
ncbi:MAG: aspartate aminotransferase family protein [Acidimicrobiia bacterium]